MPAVLRPPRRTLRPEPAPNRKRWTREDCEFLAQNGLLTGRYELVDGEIISKVGQKPPHAYSIKRLMGWLVSTFGADYVGIQLPIEVASEDARYNEPEPDACVLSKPAGAYLSANPPSSDVLLAVEVADTSLRFDLRTKAALYARAGIQEYWVLDIVGRRLLVHRDPAGGRYRQTLAYAEAEEVAPLCQPAAVLQPLDLMTQQPAEP